MSIQFVTKAMFVLGINTIQGTFWDQKRSWFIMPKFVWIGIIWVCIDKIELWGLFTTQILSSNPGAQSKKRPNEKCRFLQKFRKVPINQLVFQPFCSEINCYHFGITVQLDIMSVLYFSHYKSLKKSPKFDSKIKKFQDG